MNLYTGLLVLFIISGPVHILDGPLPWNVPDFTSIFRVWIPIIPEIELPAPTHSEDYAARLAEFEAASDSFLLPLTDLADQVDIFIAGAPDISAGMSSSTGLDPIGAGVMTWQAMADEVGEQIGAPFAYGKGAIAVTTSIGDEYEYLAPIAAMLGSILIFTVWMFLVNIVIFIIRLMKMLISVMEKIMGALAKVAGAGG